MKRISIIAISLVMLCWSSASADALDDAYHEKFDLIHTEILSSRAQLEAEMLTKARNRVMNEHATRLGDLIAQEKDLKIKLIEKNGKLPGWWIEDEKK